MATARPIIPLTLDLTQADALSLLKILADDTRWRIIHRLRFSDHQVSELVELLQQPQNLISYHLGILRQAGFVQLHRSDADRRVLFYSLSHTQLRIGLAQVAAALQLPIPDPASLPAVPILFLCTGNSIRSQMAEAWVRHLSGGRVPVQSAGNRPQPIHPLTYVVMQEVGLDLSQHTPKGIEVLQHFPAQIGVSVCDFAREDCPTFLHVPVLLHWSIPQPERLRRQSGSSELEVFRRLRDTIRERVEGLFGLLPTLVAQYALQEEKGDPYVQAD